MNSPAPLANNSSTIAQTIAAEAEALQQFVELLKAEQASLSSGHTDDLPALAEKKVQLAEQLSSIAARRNAALVAHGFENDRAGVEAWCKKHPHDITTDNSWLSVLAQAAEARELNRLNGELIQMRMQYIAKALEALQGGNKSLDLYGPDGQSTTVGRRRIYDAV